MPCTWSQARPTLIQTSLQAPKAGFKLAETGFNHPRLFLSQAEISTPEGGYMKAEASAILLTFDSTHTVSTNHLESSPTSKAVKYSAELTCDCTLPPASTKTYHPPLTSKQCYSFRGGIAPGDMTKNTSKGLILHCSNMHSTCYDLVGNGSTVADRGERQVKYDSGSSAGRGSNQVKFYSSNPADSGRNQVKFDSSNPADSSSPQLQFDRGTFTARQKDGGALFARYMFALGLPNFLGARIPVPTNLNLKA